MQPSESFLNTNRRDSAEKKDNQKNTDHYTFYNAKFDPDNHYFYGVVKTREHFEEGPEDFE